MLNNTLYWTNNKRKLSGLPLRRKIKLIDVFRAHKDEIYHEIEQEINTLLWDKINNLVSGYVDYRSLT